MNLLTLLLEAFNDGVSVSKTPDGKLKIEGKDEAVKKWFPVLKERKDELTASLPAWRWEVFRPGRSPVLAHFVPFATKEEVMRLYPDAEYVGMA